MSVLSIRDLTVDIPTRRGTLRVVDGVSWDIAAGEMMIHSSPDSR